MAYFNQWLRCAQNDPTLADESLLALARRRGVPLPPFADRNLEIYLKLYLSASDLSQHLVHHPLRTVWLRFITAILGRSLSNLPLPLLLRAGKVRRGASTLQVLQDLLSQWLGNSVLVRIRAVTPQPAPLVPSCWWRLGCSERRLGINTGLGTSVNALKRQIVIELGYPRAEQQNVGRYTKTCQPLLQAYLGSSWQWNLRVYCRDPAICQLGTLYARLSLTILG
jgi:hypothetical protein